MSGSCLIHLHRFGSLIKVAVYEIRAGSEVTRAVKHGAHADIAISSAAARLLVIPVSHKKVRIEG